MTVKQYIYCLAPWPEKFHYLSWRVYWIDPPPSSPLNILLCINVGLTYTSPLPLHFPSNFVWAGVDNIFAFGVHSKSKASEDKFKSIVGLGLSQLTNTILDNSPPNLSGVQRGITKYFIQYQMYWQQKKDLCLSNLQSSNVPVVKYICHLTRQYYLHMVNFNSVKQEN